MQTVLVTGGAGYVGSHTCKALSRAGYRPVVFDNLVFGHREAVRWGPLEVGELEDTTRLDAVFKAYEPAAVIHFAAYAYVGESVANPAKYYRNNVVGTLCLLEAMLRHDVKSLVFSSTCATYGEPDRQPIDETTPQRPINPYGSSKLMVERILADFDPAYGLKSACLRYFNASGADSDGELGEEHDPETHLIPLAIRAALDPSSPLTVFGQDYPTPDGSAVRDYVHVEDLAKTHLAALVHLAGGGESCAVNVAAGRGSSVLEVIAAVEAASGRKVPWSPGPRRSGDPPTLVADPSKLAAVLGVDPADFQTLDQIVASAWAWHARQAGINLPPHRR